MKEVGAECGVKAEAIVILDYSKDFPIRGRAVLSAWRSSAGGSPGGARGSSTARSCDKKPDLPRRPLKGELGTRTVTWPRPHREAPK